MTGNTPSLSDYARRMRFLVEEDVRIAADLRELAKEMRDDGLSAASLKALVKAMVLAEDGNERPLERLKTKIQDMAIYADALGITIDGFGETKRFVSDPAVTEQDGGAGVAVEATPAPAPIEEPGEHRTAADSDPSAPGDILTDGSPSQAPHACGAGALERPMRAGRPTISEPVAAPGHGQPPADPPPCSLPAAPPIDDLEIPAFLRRVK